MHILSKAARGISKRMETQRRQEEISTMAEKRYFFGFKTIEKEGCKCNSFYIVSKEKEKDR